ncbi:glycosyltransferase family 25 protein [Loktanella sp. DJP18]|uniref:glycosyltransferase family 25 protein n=1 Tax=Loktanella sp. DJP18 TaxID=3409788 RepID=UPI003BB609D6
MIHLPRATDRKARMQAEFDRVGINVDDWAGVDARLPHNADRLAALPDHGPWGHLHAHAKGCLLSHLDAMQRFVDSSASHALILEDDVFVADDLSVWMAVEQWWPADADLVKIERWRDDRLRVVMDAACATHSGRAIQRLRSRHSGAGGYFISRAGAHRVLTDPQRNVPVDHLLFNGLVSPLATQLVTYQINPALVVQGNEAPASSGHRAASAARRKPVSQKIRRGLAELRILRVLPRLLTGQSRLHRVDWQNITPIA